MIFRTDFENGRSQWFYSYTLKYNVMPWIRRRTPYNGVIRILRKMHLLPKTSQEFVQTVLCPRHNEEHLKMVLTHEDISFWCEGYWLNPILTVPLEKPVAIALRRKLNL